MTRAGVFAAARRAHLARARRQRHACRRFPPTYAQRCGGARALDFHALRCRSTIAHTARSSTAAPASPDVPHSPCALLDVLAVRAAVPVQLGDALDVRAHGGRLLSRTCSASAVGAVEAALQRAPAHRRSRRPHAAAERSCVPIGTVQLLRQPVKHWRGGEPAPARPAGWVGQLCDRERRPEAALSQRTHPARAHVIHRSDTSKCMCTCSPL